MRVARLGEIEAGRMAAWSRRALDAPLVGDALLVVARPSSRLAALGAFQRRAALGAPGEPRPERRGSGGATASVGPGTLWVGLSLASASALVACEPSRIANRYVRPLLRALAKVGAPARYFDRDWISVAHRPAALVSFAHDATSGRALFEAIVAVSAPFTEEARASFLGKEPGTLAEIVGRDFDLAAIEDAVVDAYAPDRDRDLDLDLDLDLDRDLDPDPDPDDPPWAASVPEAIGAIGAGLDARGVFRVGGDLVASRDAVAALEARVADAAIDDVPRIVDATLAAPGVALFGVKELASVARAITLARLRR